MLKLIKIGNQFATILHKQFLVDGQSDVQNLPGLDQCDPGSVAYTADMNSVWQLGNDGQWHKMGG